MAKDEKIRRSARDGSPSTHLITLADIWHTPKPHKNTGDIILYDGRLAVYRHSLDLIFYLIANQDENELMINTALSAFSNAVHILLWNQVEKRAVLENPDLVLLGSDETIDDGYVAHNEPFFLPAYRGLTLTLRSLHSIIVETDSTTITSRVSRPTADMTEIVINEQTIMNASRQ